MKTHGCNILAVLMIGKNISINVRGLKKLTLSRDTHKYILNIDIMFQSMWIDIQIPNSANKM